MNQLIPALCLTVVRDTHGRSTRLFEYVGEPHDEEQLHAVVAYVAQLVAMDREGTRVSVVLARRVLDRLAELLSALRQAAPNFSLSVH